MKRIDAPYGFVRLELSRQEFETLGYGIKSTSSVLRELSAESDEQNALENIVNEFVDIEIDLKREHLTLDKLRRIRVRLETAVDGVGYIEADAHTTAPVPTEPGMVLFTRSSLEPVLKELGLPHTFNVHGNLELNENPDEETDRKVILPVHVEGFDFYTIDWEWAEVEAAKET